LPVAINFIQSHLLMFISWVFRAPTIREASTPKRRVLQV